jgi:F0F1-type ATP synthase assembly protein I
VKINSNNVLRQTVGGLGLLATIVAGVVIGAAIEIISDWDNFKAGLNVNYEQS